MNFSKIILLFIIIFSFRSIELAAQLTIYTFEQVDSLQLVEARPIVVFIHTDWCNYCKAMEQTTLQNEVIMQALNENFYFVALDSEEERDIIFRGHTFYFKPTGYRIGVHELAEQLGTINGKISYPTLCFLNEYYEIILQHDGFLKAKIFRKILNKIGI